MMKHIFIQGKDQTKPTFLLLHGTGGTELSLLPLAGMIEDEASILSVRGEVLENGMPRFFKRLAEGIFDEEDLILRTKNLHEYLDAASKEYNFDRSNVIAIGYSNGANIAASLLFHYSNSLKGAILHHPMVPRRGIELPNLDHLPIFIAAGENDPICPLAETNELQTILKQAGANVHTHWENHGHSLTQTEVQAAAEWYQQNF